MFLTRYKTQEVELGFTYHTMTKDIISKTFTYTHAKNMSTYSPSLTSNMVDELCKQYHIVVDTRKREYGCGSFEYGKDL